MNSLKYLKGYPATVTDQIDILIKTNKLSEMLLSKYPDCHKISSNKALYAFTMDLKRQFLRQSNPLSKVIYDDKINVLHHALGTHSFVSRVQGSKLKSKNEIRIDSVFKKAPIEFLKMIVVHELAHLKEKQHNKAFYKLCLYMEPEYHQLEFDMRLYLTHIYLKGKPA